MTSLRVLVSRAVFTETIVGPKPGRPPTALDPEVLATQVADHGR